MQDSNAYQTGYHIGVIIGVIMMSVILLGLTAFFIFALVKAIKTKRTGWVIGAVVSGLPFLLLLSLFLYGVVKGFNQAINRSTEISAAQKHQPSEMITAELTPVRGTAIPYSISMPALKDWQKTDTRSPFDYMFSYHDAYVGIVAEGVGLGTPENIRDITQTNLATRADNYSTGPSTHLTIDGRTWITYDVNATMHGVKIKYRFFVYADADYSFQIITWSGPLLFDRFSPVFDRIAGTFKLPPPAK